MAIFVCTKECDYGRVHYDKGAEMQVSDSLVAVAKFDTVLSSCFELRGKPPEKEKEPKPKPVAMSEYHHPASTFRMPEKTDEPQKPVTRKRGRPKKGSK